MQDQVLDVVVELLPDRQVIAVDLVEVVDLDLGRARPERGACSAAGDDVREDEDDEQHHSEDDHDRLNDASDQVPDHRWLAVRKLVPSTTGRGCGR